MLETLFMVLLGRQIRLTRLFLMLPLILGACENVKYGANHLLIEPLIIPLLRITF